MPTVNDKFLRAELQAARERIEALRKSGRVSPKADDVFHVLMPLLTLLLAVPMLLSFALICGRSDSRRTLAFG